MKIGILTFHYSNNYGALFQAYGLSSYLRKLGHDVEFINYNRKSTSKLNAIKLNNFLSKSTIKIVYHYLIDIKEKYLGNEDRREQFQIFKNNYLLLNGSTLYRTRNELEEANLVYDILITGSDQVWNPSEEHGVDPVYYLDFKTSNPNVKKISFAPSFGKNTVDEKYYNDIGRLISKLDCVSVREETGKELIHELTSIQARLLPDPTVLISDYDTLIKPFNTESNDYIFCYYLRTREVVGDVAEYISRKDNLHIYSPYNSHRRWKEIGNTVYPGPREWLYLLNNSKLVITNSFHGTMMSILLNKPFIAIGIGTGDRSEYNERALNIMKQCGLEKRFITKFDRQTIDNIRDEFIDWSGINDKISELRQEAVAFLNDILANSSIRK